VREIKNQILITVHYLVEAVRDEFWESDSGELNKQVEESLKRRFPKKTKLKEELHAQRYSLTHQIIDHPNANLMKCPICKRLITDKSKPRPIYSLDVAEELEGVLMCSSCAWEMAYSIKCGSSIESILEKFKDKD